MRPKRQIENALWAALEVRGWLFERIEGLRKVFVRREIFTPCFWPAVAGRSAGWYSLDGYIGVVDREFEALWRQTHADLRPQFPLLMHIANFAELGGHSVDPPAIEEGVARFVAALETFLRQCPASRAEMRSAFDSGKLFGRSVEEFAWVYDTADAMVVSAKFDEFRAFLSRPH